MAVLWMCPSAVAVTTTLYPLGTSGKGVGVGVTPLWKDPPQADTDANSATVINISIAMRILRGRSNNRPAAQIPATIGIFRL